MLSRAQLQGVSQLVHTWGDNIEMDLKEIVCEDVEWIHLAKDRGWLQASLNTAMKVRIP
jgi:hypothetical protein